jgi:OOP family OmpA-OmpF porin
MKKIFLLLIAVTGITAAFAQLNTDYLKIADDFFRRKDYLSAAMYYEKCLAGKSKDKKPGYKPYAVETAALKTAAKASTRNQVVYNLAECYRLLNNPSKAGPYYKEAATFDKKQFPFSGYHYATVLRALGKFEEAEKEFQSFLDGYKTDDAYGTSAKREILNLHFIQSQLKRKDLALYTVSKQLNEINNGGANYAPVWVNTNTVLFTSSRADSSAARYHAHTNRLYLAMYENSTIAAVSSFPLAQDKDVHQGTAALSADGNTLYFTRWTVKEGKKNAAIYASNKNGDKWGEPVVLGESINANGFNSQQPFAMPDGKIVFASDRPGGKGGFDLWIADPRSGQAVNFGETINTSFDEQAPYYHANNTLIFSSNGRIGMGGFDFFESKGKPGNWSEPVNLGYPVNSVKDDIYFVSRGNERNILEDVLISSDRFAECCLELFSIQKKKIIKQVNGLVIDCETKQPLAGTSVKFFNIPDNSIAFDKISGSDGSYSFSLEEFKALKAEATLAGYEKGTLQFNTPADESSAILNNEAICLVKIKEKEPEVGEVIVLENVYYQFNKYKLSKESYPALDKIVELLNTHPAMRIEMGSHTDALGDDTYNERLSQQRAQSCVAYLISKGISKDRLEAKGYGEKAPVEPNTNNDGTDNAEGRKKNRRTEFKVLEN